MTQSNAESTEAFPVETTTFTVFVTDSNGCTASDDLTVYVGQPPFVDAGPDREVEWLDSAALVLPKARLLVDTRRKSKLLRVRATRSPFS